VGIVSVFPSTSTHLLTDEYIRDSELIHREGEWHVHLVCRRSAVVADEFDNVLAIDMGSKWIAVSTLPSDRRQGGTRTYPFLPG
jgi:putative transposase